MSLTLQASSASSIVAPSRVESDRLNAFVKTYYARLWRVLRRLGVPLHSTEDVAQEVLLVLARRLPSVKEGAEWAFAFSTSRRVIADARRRQRVRPSFVPASIESQEAVPGCSSLSDLDERDLLDHLLDGLPEVQRELIVLVELEGLTAWEAAACLSIPEGTVASRLRRARAALEAAAHDMRAQLEKKE